MHLSNEEFLNIIKKYSCKYGGIFSSIKNINSVIEITECNVGQGDMRQGDMRQGDMRQGDMRQGDMRQGDMRQGDMLENAIYMIEMIEELPPDEMFVYVDVCLLNYIASDTLDAFIIKSIGSLHNRDMFYICNNQPDIARWLFTKSYEFDYDYMLEYAARHDSVYLIEIYMDYKIKIEAVYSTFMPMILNNIIKSDAYKCLDWICNQKKIKLLTDENDMVVRYRSNY